MDQHSRLQSITFLAALVFLLAVAGWAAPLRAAEAEGVAMVVALRGQVTAVDQAGEQRPLAVKSPVYVSDTVRTGPAGRLQLMFTDNTIVSLGGNAELEVAAYQWDDRQGELTTRVNQGAFRVMGGSIARTSPENFTTETPAATIGIRGSMYAGRVSNGMLTVVFQGGTGIIVSNPAGTVEITVPGMGTRVRTRTEAPAPPTRFSGAELEELQEGLPEEEEGAEEAAAEEVAAAEEAEPVDEWAEAVSDEPAETAAAPVVADDPVVEQVGEVVSEAAQEELEQEIVGSAGYSGRGVRVWYSEEGEQVGDFGRENLLLTSKPAILTAIEPDLLLENGQSGFSTGDYGDVWWYEDFSYESSGEGDSFVLNDRFSITMVDNRGEFWVYNQWDYTETATGFAKEDLLFFHGLETVSSQMPASGGAIYNGIFAGAGDLDFADYMDNIFGSMEVAVNWRTGQAVGYFIDYDDDRLLPVYLLARVDGSRLAAVDLFGQDRGDGFNGVSPGAIVGGGTFAQFYGSEYQGLGLAAQGQMISLLDQESVTETWSVAAGAYRDPLFVYFDPDLPASWQGFTTGMALNLSAEPGVAPVFLRNTEATDFGLVIDRQAGTFSGSIDGLQASGGDYTVGGLEAGGLYVTDQHLAGEITGTGLNPHGNYLGGSGNHGGALAEHLSWGYWALSFDEPLSGDAQIFSSRGSFWVAGELTPAGVVQDLIDAGNVVGDYVGGAEGVMVLGDAITDLVGGTTNLSINFGAIGAAVSGDIFFPEVNVELQIGGASSLTSSGFAAEITAISGLGGGTPHPESGISGAFFGPDARAIGGNFQAETDSAQYLGIFGGTRGDW